MLKFECVDKREKKFKETFALFRTKRLLNGNTRTLIWAPPSLFAIANVWAAFRPANGANVWLLRFLY